MRVLLDNCVHLRVQELLPGHKVSHVSELGWAGVGNGALLPLAATRFDVPVTTDQNMRHQQNLWRLPLPVIELNARDKRTASLRAFAPWLERALELTAAHLFVSVSAGGRFEARAPRR